MHMHSMDPWLHAHDFHLEATESERRTAWVIALTASTMVIEVVTGYLFGSMALLADGWHMGTHVAALGISVYAYRYARKHAGDPRFSFGTGKVTALGGFASAMALAVVAVLMGMESLQRLVSPQIIRFDEAILVATLGLVVNLASAWLLHGGHDSHHTEALGDHHHHHHHDHNLRAAYLHVIADALTSVLAIIALTAGKFLGWVWMDAAMGLVGATLITRWGYALLKDTSGVLLDSSPNEQIVGDIRERIESDADNQISDLHVWHLGPRDLAVILSVVTHEARPPGHYKALLQGVPRLGHVTVEVNQCTEERCGRAGKGSPQAQSGRKL